MPASHSNFASQFNTHQEQVTSIMGNEASRVDGAGLSPTALGRTSSGPKLPATPLSTPAARRAQSFSGVSGGAATPRASSTSSTSSSSSSAPANAGVERTIQRMDRAIRKRVRGGVTYNMRIAVRGARGTGKTSLFQRLKGEPIPETHEPTPQLQSATINWSFRAGSEESVKCEVWDVVDRGFDPLAPPDAAAAAGSGAAAGAAGDAGAGEGDERASSPFELGALQSNSNFASVRASAAVAASIAGASGATGSHTVATVDATTVDVYHETHGVVFLLDVTKWDTLEYVRQQLEKVPVHIPTLVLGNFRDCGNQRKIFKEDIQDLLYGSSDRSRQQQQQLRRPHELLYFECSLLNCYGLKSLHQYFGIPFLQLKLATIRQQMRIVEGEFSHLKHDLQAKISEQRYSDYVEHIKATGSDIRTGRKAPGGPALRHSESTIVVNGSSRHDSTNGDAGDQRQFERVARTHSNASTGSDIVLPMERTNETEVSSEPPAAVSVPAPNTVAGSGAAVSSAEQERQVSEPAQKDLEDLPERTNSLADQMTASLKFEHSASSSSLREEPQVQPPVPVPAPVTGKQEAAGKASKAPSKLTPSAAAQENGGKPSVAATAIDEPMNLEDFQVPKQKNNDLDSFYSDDDSDANGESDEDVIIPPSAALMAKKHSHKQQFIYSDSSDSDDDKSSRRALKTKHSPRRGRGVVAKANKSAPAPADASSVRPSPSTESTTTQESEAVNATEPTAGTDTTGPVHAPQQQQQPSVSPDPPLPSSTAPPASPTTRPTSPGARTSRSPSPRQKLEVSRSHSPRMTASQQQQPQPDTASVASASVEGNEQVEQEPESCDDSAEALADTTVVSDAAVATSKPESPVVHTSPRHRLQPIKNSPAASPRGAEAVVGVPLADDAPDADDLEEAQLEDREKGSESNAVASANAPTPLSSADATSAELDDAEGDEQVVNSDDIDKFFSDNEDEDDEGPSSAVLETAESVESQPVAAASGHVTQPISKRTEMLVSDDEEEDEDSNVELAGQNRNGAPNGSVQASSGQRGSEHSFVPGVNESKVADSFFSDDENEDALPPPRLAAASAPSSKSAHRPKQRPGMVMSDDDDDSDASSEEPAMAPLRPTLSVSQPRAVVQSSTRSSLSSRPAPDSPRNELDAFFSESDSASEAGSRVMFPAPPAGGKSALRAPMRHMVAGSDDEDDEDDGRGGSKVADRFANYDAKLVRKSKAERRQEREEIRRMTSSLSNSRHLDAATTPVTTTVAGTASADVLAAIRAAQEEALRMLPPASDPSSDGGEEKKRKKKHTSSRVKSSQSSTHHHQQRDDAIDASATSKRRSSKSSSSSSSRSSRRRET